MSTSTRLMVRVAAAAGLVLLASTAGARAQSTTDGTLPELQVDSPKVVRFGLGVGAGTMGTGETEIAARTALSIELDERSFITIRSALVEEFTLWGPSPPERVWDAGVLYGRQTHGRWGYASAAAGLALVGSTQRGERITPPVECSYSPFCALAGLFQDVEYEPVQSHTMGIPVELEVGFTPFRFLGIKATAWANFNPHQSMQGATVGFVLGRLR